MSESLNGISPAGRTKVTLGDIARNISENEYNPKEKGLDRCVGLEHLDPGSLRICRWSPITPEMSFTRRFYKGQILFGKRRAYQKKVSLADFDGICSSDILVIEAKKENFVPELLPYILQDDRFFEYAVGTSSGSLSPRTKWKFLAEYEIWLPSLNEQHRIATTLGAAEDCIVKGERFFAAGERAKQVLMRELFSKGIGHKKLFVDPSISQMPLDWKAIKIGDPNYFERVQSGGTPRVTERKFYNGDIPFVKIEDITNSNKYLSSTQTKITREGLENSSAWLVPSSSILYSMYASYGEVVINSIPVATNQAILAIIPSEKMNLDYSYYALVHLKGSIHKSVQETTQKNLNCEIVKNFKIPLPPYEEQKQIAAILTRCDETIAAARANVEAAKVMKMKLINEFLNA